MSEPITLPLADAAKSVGLSQRTLTDAHDRGDLVGYWSGSKRLFEPAELRAWIKSMPTQRPVKGAS